MKTNLIFACFLLAGCQSAPPVLQPVADLPPMRTQPVALVRDTVRTEGPPATALPERPSAAAAEKLTRQRQWIEALMAQNDALTARLNSLKHTAAGKIPPPAVPKTQTIGGSPKHEPLPPRPASVGSAAASVLASAKPPSAPIPLLVPNAEGVIDTTVLNTAGNPPNPFAVRTLPPGSVREVTFVVGGTFQGGSSCALINGRVAAVGDLVESLRLTRITPTTLTLTGDGFAISLPLGSTKVRLAL